MVAALTASLKCSAEVFAAPGKQGARGRGGKRGGNDCGEVAREERSQTEHKGSNAMMPLFALQVFIGSDQRFEALAAGG